MGKGLRNSLFWQLYNVLGLAVIQLVYYAVLARILDPRDFGLMAIANSFVNFAQLFSQIGMGPALIQHRDPSARHISTSFYVNLGVGLVLYAATALGAGGIAHFFDSPELVGILPILCLSFILSAAASSSMSLIQRAMDFKYLFWVENLSHLIGMGVGVVTALTGSGVWSLVYGTLAYQFVQLAIVLSRTPLRLGAGFGQAEFRELFHFGAGLTLIRINNYLTNSGLNLLLGKLMPLNMLGVFERSYRIMMIPGKMLGDVIDKVMFPAMSRIQDENERLVGMYERNLSYSLLLTLPISVWLAIHAEPVVLLLLGSEWTEAIPTLGILFLAIPFRVCIRLTDSIIRAKGLVYRSALQKFLYTVVLFSALIGTARWGLSAVAWTILATSVFQFFNMSALAIRRVGMDWAVQYRPFLPSLPLMAVFAASGVLLQYGLQGSGLWRGLLAASLSLILSAGVVLVLYRVAPRWLGEPACEILDRLAKLIRKKTGIRIKP
ncbi:oligosaccharide flippase family protein [bacterium]|nr:oligosaccharide flippase family protein [bacterium]